jgi:hypothetical protein
MRSTTLSKRYAPFLILAAVQLLLVIVAPSKGAGSQSAAQGQLGPGGQSNLPGVQGSQGPGGVGGVGGVSSSSGRGVGPGGTQTGTASSQFGHISNDKSKCAPGGTLQQNVTLISPQCVGRWVGWNGGATWSGVTEKQITIVYVRVPVPSFLEPIFVRGGLAATKQQEEDSLQTWGKFFAKHYEFYGRHIKWVLHELTCQSTDPNYVGCWRQEAHLIQKKYHPFGVFVFGGGGLPEFFDELSRMGIMSVGGQHLSAAFDRAHRPYHYDLFADGDELMTNLADYWCQKMVGKKASRAGDPLIQVENRKLGLVVEQQIGGTGIYPPIVPLFQRLVTGGMCGSSADKPVTVTYSGDTSQAASEMTAAATTFSNAHVTTVVCLCTTLTPVFMTQAFDDQKYYPEHLMTGGGAMDVDPVGRLYSPSQWKNAFGPSFWPNLTPIPQSDQGKAWHDVGAPGDPCLVCGSIWEFMEPTVDLLQWAGPNLTPFSMEQGAFAAPAIAGWEVSHHNPEVPMWKFGPDYTAWQDCREVYFDPAARSPYDGQPGAYVPVHGGKRYVIVTWAKGDPLQ